MESNLNEIHFFLKRKWIIIYAISELTKMTYIANEKIYWLKDPNNLGNINNIVS